jgi:hypothetical protein
LATGLVSCTSLTRPSLTRAASFFVFCVAMIRDPIRELRCRAGAPRPHHTRFLHHRVVPAIPGVAVVVSRVVSSFASLTPPCCGTPHSSLSGLLATRHHHRHLTTLPPAAIIRHRAIPPGGE